MPFGEMERCKNAERMRAEMRDSSDRRLGMQKKGEEQVSRAGEFLPPDASSSLVPSDESELESCCCERQTHKRIARREGEIFQPALPPDPSQ